MADIFFKCSSCEKHLVVDDADRRDRKYESRPDCNDIVVVPVTVVHGECQRCGQEMKFAGDMMWELVSCSACKSDMALLATLHPSSEANSSAVQPKVLTPEGDGSAVKKYADALGQVSGLGLIYYEPMTQVEPDNIDSFVLEAGFSMSFTAKLLPLPLEGTQFPGLLKGFGRSMTCRIRPMAD